MGDVTLLLKAAGDGEPEATARLFEVVYDELRKLAARELKRERSGHTLQPTALVNEAYLRLVRGDGGWESRKHFFGAAANAMRQVLVDHARRRRRVKRDVGSERVSLSGIEDQQVTAEIDLIAIDQVLDLLAVESPRLAEIVKLRVFVGLSVEECADVLGVAPITVKRDWAFAKAWLVERVGTIWAVGAAPEA